MKSLATVLAGVAILTCQLHTSYGGIIPLAPRVPSSSSKAAVPSSSKAAAKASSSGVGQKTISSNGRTFETPSAKNPLWNPSISLKVTGTATALPKIETGLGTHSITGDGPPSSSGVHQSGSSSRPSSSAVHKSGSSISSGRKTSTARSSKSTASRTSSAKSTASTGKKKKSRRAIPASAPLVVVRADRGGSSSSQTITVYHATCAENVAGLRRGPIRTGDGSPGDFSYRGGFYVTPSYAVAEAMARDWIDCAGDRAVVQFKVDTTGKRFIYVRGSQAQQFAQQQNEVFGELMVAQAENRQPQLSTELAQAKNLVDQADAIDGIMPLEDWQKQGKLNDQPYHQVVILTDQLLARFVYQQHWTMRKRTPSPGGA